MGGLLRALLGAVHRLRQRHCTFGGTLLYKKSTKAFPDAKKTTETTKIV